MDQNIWSLLGMLAVVGAILAMAYWCTRFVGRHGWAGFGGQGSAGFGGVRQRGSLNVLRQMNIGRGERLLLIRLGNRCLLLGVTNGTITVLAELSEEEAEPFLINWETNAQSPKFIDALRDCMTKKK